MVVEISNCIIIHDVTVLGGGGQEFCDNNKNVSAIKNYDDATGGREVKKCPKLRDAIYGQLPNSDSQRCKNNGLPTTNLNILKINYKGLNSF